MSTVPDSQLPEPHAPEPHAPEPHAPEPHASERTLAPFDLTGPLPTGTTVLEASAGTGKTFTVGALVTRYVAEGMASIEEMLVITFGRAASQELRERVRGALVDAERAFADQLAPEQAPDAVIAHLLTTDDVERTRRHRRLRDALASFDAATIATTHQFCQLVLRSLGVAGDTDAGAELVDTLDDLVTEVVDDLYLQRFSDLPQPPPFTRAVALRLATQAIGDPQATLAPADYDLNTLAGQRVDFAHAVRAEVERRKRRLGLLSYDDLLSRLSGALADEAAPARERMRQRWRIVLVDEFQDTDPVQWQVLDRAFTGHATMVLIGDPKQAIYAFRGGDVATYLAATDRATHRATLARNWRSDAALVERLQVVLAGAALGDPRIVVHDVVAGQMPRLEGAPHPSPFRIRAVARNGLRLTKSKDIVMGEARTFIARDLAGDVAELLASPASFEGRPVRAGDIACLVQTREHGQLVQRALQACGIPAVVAGGGHVLLTSAADEWLTLLEALEQPHRAGLVRTAALTSFFGETTLSLDEGGDALTDRIADALRGWSLLVRGRGVAALFEAAEERGLTSRVLGRIDGERQLTDLRHIAQTLHEVAVHDRLGLTALLTWFRAERSRNRPTSDRTRRLDSDAAAVQIVTVHAAKGLQYPIVYLPFAFSTFPFPVEVALFHDDDGRRLLDVAGGGPQWPDHERRHQAEEAGEELRELYVALTRAQSQVVAWWAPTANTPDGGLHRLIFGRQPGVNEVPDRQPVRDDDYVEEVLKKLDQLGGPTFERAVVAETTPPPATAPSADLAIRRFDRGIDTDWRRTSYSGLIRSADELAPAEPVGVGSEPDGTPLDDEPNTDSSASAERETAGQVADESESMRSPMAELPAGATFGSLVHGVLEHADPEAPDLLAEVRRHVAEQRRWWSVEAETDALAEALLPLQHTPLGPLAGELTLAQIGLGDRLRELDFEFPLDGGDRRDVGHDVRVGALAPLLRHHLPTDDALRPYADRLAQPALGDQSLRGYLSGSIDVVLRVPSPEQGANGESTYLVVDYKTNLLGSPGQALTAADYAAPRLTEAMLHSDYPLQALLYCVVTHRYLRWRLPDYDPERHLGGVLYLYVRGMCGPATPRYAGQPAGVFAWKPPAALVVDLSDTLAGLARPSREAVRR